MKYELEKYRGPGSRHTCPACHAPRSFTLYVDTATGDPLSAEVGRCDHENRCGYHYTPKQYFADHPEARPQFPGAKLQPFGNPGAVSRPEPQLRDIDRIPREYVARSLGYGSDLIRYLLSLFDTDKLESPAVTRLMGEYYLGCTRDGAVIFWQIDTEKRARGGKIMRYDPGTGHRIKNAATPVDWVHARLKRAGKLPEGWTLTQCLFGAHLLNRRPGDTVCLVESEKTAVICSGVMPRYVWLATGGKQNLKAEMCGILRGRDVILFPDLGAFDDWKEKGEQIARRVGFSLMVSDLLERTATPADRAAGLDIADYLTRDLLALNQTAVVRSPAQSCPTDEERALWMLAGKNPAVWQLIDTLDLVSSSTRKPLRRPVC